MATYSTLAEAQTAYLANADWAETGSSSKAKTFVSACRALLLLMPTQAAQGDVSTQFDMDAIREQMASAQQYVNDTVAGTGGMVDVSFEEFRT